MIENRCMSPASNTRSLRELQNAMDSFVARRGWYAEGSCKPQLPRNLAASIVLEAGEILECFQWSDEPPDKAALADELADVVLYVAQLANMLGVDLESAAASKLARNESRWPAANEDQWSTLAS